MSQQVERLQALLERVQRNRGARPAAAPAAAVAVAAAAQAAFQERPEPMAPARAQAAPGGRAKTAPTPLEMALEDRASRRVDPPTQPISFTPGPMPRAAVPPPAQPLAQSPASEAGRVLSDPEPAEPSKPIVQVVSRQPPIAASSFGELLRRSLSLRPR